MRADEIGLWINYHTTNGGWIREGEFSLPSSSEERIHGPGNIPVFNRERFE